MVGTRFIRLNGTIRYWWTYLTLGITYLCLAGWLFTFYIEDIRTFNCIFSVFILFCCIFEFIFSIGNRKVLFSWNWYLGGALIDLSFGLYLLCNPMITTKLFIYLLSIWLMVRGFSGIGSSIDAYLFGSRRWKLYLPVAVIVFILSIAIIWLPSKELAHNHSLIILSFVMLGVLRILLSFDMKRVYRINKVIAAERIIAKKA